MFSGYKMVIDDPSKFYLLSDQMQQSMIKAAINTVNIQAALTRKNALQEITQFTLRNTWTKRAIAYDRADENATTLEGVESHVGARDRAPYMERQEFGGLHKPSNGGQLSIPTNATRGGSNSNPVKKNMYRSRIARKTINYNPTKHSTGSSSLVSAAVSAYKQNKYLKYGKNIYKVTNFRKNGDNINFELEMVYFRGLTQTVTKAAPWLEPSMQKPAQDGQKIFNSQMNKLDR